MPAVAGREVARMKLYEQTGEFKPDSLIAGNRFPILTEGIGLKAGSGVLRRGTLILRGEDRAGYPAAAGTIALLAEEAGRKVFGILTDDVDTGTDPAAENVPGTAYRTGEFSRADVIVAGEGAGAGAYEEEMNDRGIYLRGVQEYESEGGKENA